MIFTALHRGGDKPKVIDSARRDVLGCSLDQVPVGIDADDRAQRIFKPEVVDVDIHRERVITVAGHAQVLRGKIRIDNRE